ncbi:hypothetical protein I4U23_016536 [Adineta vaga]|nr:hypothetical protein I4U23_016536 [Adineta vaga]
MSTELSFKLTHNILRVNNSNELIQFYVNNFGMKINHLSLPSNVHILGYSINSDENLTSLEFHDNDSTSIVKNSSELKIYWKIGITLYDVNYAQKILISKGIDISEPSQFEDIGYVCHLIDPNGFNIELLQHDFEKTFKDKINKQLPKDNFPLGYPCCIGQITFHSNDINETEKFYCDLLGMKLLSIQEVPKYGFTLYFFAWTNENTPSSDIKDATINREWLWKRPYTMIEIRYFNGTKQIPPFRDLQENEIGFQGIRIMCNHLDKFREKMKEENIHFKESNGIFGREIIIRDPDNIPIYFTSTYSQI